MWTIPRDGDASRLRIVNAGEAAEQGGFPGPVTAHEGNYLSALDPERDSTQHGTSVIAGNDLLRGQQLVRCGSHRPLRWRKPVQYMTATFPHGQGERLPSGGPRQASDGRNTLG